MPLQYFQGGKVDASEGCYLPPLQDGTMVAAFARYDYDRGFAAGKGDLALVMQYELTMSAIKVVTKVLKHGKKKTGESEP